MCINMPFQLQSRAARRKQKPLERRIDGLGVREIGRKRNNETQRQKKTDSLRLKDGYDEYFRDVGVLLPLIALLKVEEATWRTCLNKSRHG